MLRIHRNHYVETRKHLVVVDRQLEIGALPGVPRHRIPVHGCTVAARHFRQFAVLRVGAEHGVDLQTDRIEPSVHGRRIDDRVFLYTDPAGLEHRSRMHAGNSELLKPSPQFRIGKRLERALPVPAQCGTPVRTQPHRRAFRQTGRLRLRIRIEKQLVMRPHLILQRRRLMNHRGAFEFFDQLLR